MASKVTATGIHGNTLLPLTAALFWGLSYTLNEKVLSKISSVQLLFIESFLYIVFLLPIVLLDKRNSIPAAVSSLKGSQSGVLFLLTGMVIGMLANWLILYSISKVGSSTAAVLEVSYPVFVVLFSYLLFQKKINLPTIFGGVLIFAGSLIVVLNNRS